MVASCLPYTVILCLVVVPLAAATPSAANDSACPTLRDELNREDISRAGQVHGISLLQRAALYKKSQATDSNAHPSKADYTFSPAGSRFPTTSYVVVRGPRVLHITEGCIVLFGVAVVCAFFWTEMFVTHPWMRQSHTIGRSLDSKNFISFEEQILQDFIVSSAKPYIIATDGREPLTYARFHAFVKSREVNVSRFGVSSCHRLASLLGSGPETVVAFWVFSVQCAFAPINDEASAEEIDFTLLDLPAKAVVMRQQDIQGRRFRVGVPILEYCPHLQIAGLFSLRGLGVEAVDDPEMETQVHTARGSIALVIQTAGTTKKPKTCTVDTRKPNLDLFHHRRNDWASSR